MLNETLNALMGIVGVLVLIVSVAAVVILWIGNYAELKRLDAAMRDRTAAACYRCHGMFAPVDLVTVSCGLSSRRFCRDCYEIERERLFLHHDSGRVLVPLNHGPVDDLGKTG